MAYPFLICFSFFRVSLSIMVVREGFSSFYILVYVRMAWELGCNGLSAQVFDEVQEVRYIAVERNGTLQLRLLTVSWKSLIQWWNFFLILHLLWRYSLYLNIFFELKYFAKLILCSSTWYKFIRARNEFFWLIFIISMKRCYVRNPTTY